MSNWMFKLRGDLTRNQSLILGLVGFLLFILVWWLASEQLSVYKYIDPEYTQDLAGLTDAQRDSIAVADSQRTANMREAGQLDSVKTYRVLPPPMRVLGSYESLINNDMLFPQILKSLWVNVQGYVWAVLISIIVGFMIGLFPLFRGLFNKQIDAIRYLPLSALVGLFLVWFGIGGGMKVAFLAFGILVYLLPIVVQRINEVKDVYLKTVHTLNANNWQTIKTVYFPSVMEKLIDDVRVLTAISWTYIILAEGYNREGGLGNLIWTSSRKGQLDKVFALLIVIVIIGFIQDQIFKLMDRKLFPHKNYKSMLPGLKESKIGVLVALGSLLAAVLINSFFGLPALLSKMIWLLVLSAILITFFGEFSTRKALAND